MKQVMIFAALALAAGLAPASADAQSDFIKQLEAGCAKDEAQDCVNLGGQLQLGLLMGKGKPEDLVQARAAFEKGCRLGHSAGCVEYYIALSTGQGGPRDPVKAKAIEAKACNTRIISLEVLLERHGLCIK